MSFFNRQWWGRALLLAATVLAVCVSNVIAQNTTGISNDSAMLYSVASCIEVEALYRVAIGAQNGSIYVWRAIEDYGGQDEVISDWNETFEHSCGILFATMEDVIGEEKFERVKADYIKSFKTGLVEKYQSNQPSKSGGGSGTFTDSRDGKTYKTVKIGKQTWMAQNLNYRAGNSWCYDNNNANCDTYGRLYDWETAKTVCPSGFHLPSLLEWDNLVTAAGGSKIAGKKLKARNGWNKNGNGTDEYGFSALPGGDRYSNGTLLKAGYYGNWWTTTENGSSHAYGRDMTYDHDNVHEFSMKKSDGFSVRCIMDN